MDTRISSDLTSEPLTSAIAAFFIKYEDGNSDELDLIEGIISEARTHFEKLTGLSFAEKTFQTLFKYGDKPFILPWSPVISITSVKTIDIEGTENSLTLNSDYYKRGLYEVEIIADDATVSNPFREYPGKYDLKIEYKAGYGNAATEDLPADLLGALKKQVKQWYDNRDDFYEFKMLGSIRAILNKYKKYVL